MVAAVAGARARWKGPVVPRLFGASALGFVWADRDGKWLAAFGLSSRLGSKFMVGPQETALGGLELTVVENVRSVRLASENIHENHE